MSLSKREVLKPHVTTVQGAIRRLLDDVSEEESLRTFERNPNHIKWLTGHLLFTAKLQAKTLGGDFDTPESWAEIFRRGAPAPKPGDILPKMADLRTSLYTGQGKVVSLIDAADDVYLETERLIMPNWTDSPLHTVLFLCAHDFYHAGQIVMIRRAMGKERSFG